MSLSHHSRTAAVWFAGAALVGAFLSSRAWTHTGVGPPSDVDRAAQTYLQLVAALVRRDPDSASGDTSMRAAAADRDAKAMPLSAIAAQAHEAADTLRDPAVTVTRNRDTQPVDVVANRRAWLTAQLGALATRAALLSGTRVTLDEELRQLFGIERISTVDENLPSIRARLDQLLSGSGTAAVRLEAFDSSVTVPADKLPAVFERALDECRVRTKARVAMPEGESVSVEFVVGKPWSAFSTYVGQARSVIAVNTSYPLTVDRVLQLACHEGYPGHHLLNTTRDERRALGRPELGAVPLFSPEAFAAEAFASTAAAQVYTDAERLRFERDVLFPLAGLPSEDAEAHVMVARLVDRLAPAIGVVLRRYLAGERDYIETTWALQSDALMQHPQTTLFFANQFRGLSLAYTQGALAHSRTGATNMLDGSGFAGGPVIISSNGHHSSASSGGR